MMRNEEDLLEIPFDNILRETDNTALLDFREKETRLPKSQIDPRRPRRKG